MYCSTFTELIIRIHLRVPHLYLQGIWLDALFCSCAGMFHILFEVPKGAQWLLGTGQELHGIDPPPVLPLRTLVPPSPPQHLPERAGGNSELVGAGSSL